MAKAKRYQAWCARCYSCFLGEATSSKRQAVRTAAGHAGAFRQDVLDVEEEARRQAERAQAKNVALGGPTL